MKNLLTIAAIIAGISVQAQVRTPPPRLDLPPLSRYILATQENMGLYVQNLADKSQEHDVNSIILDIEKYLNEPQHPKAPSDQYLNKEFNPLRHFFLTTTNKTTVATTFIYPVNPYQFCAYNDTAVALYMFAEKDGNTYSLDKITEKKAIRNVLEQCILPSLKAIDEFKDGQVKYVALSVYYGCKDTRQGAPKDPVTPYCLTLVTRLDELQQYEAGLITLKGLVAYSELYYADPDNSKTLNKIQISAE